MGWTHESCVRPWLLWCLPPGVTLGRNECKFELSFARETGRSVDAIPGVWQHRSLQWRCGAAYWVVSSVYHPMHLATRPSHLGLSQIIYEPNNAFTYDFKHLVNKKRCNTSSSVRDSKKCESNSWLLEISRILGKLWCLFREYLTVLLTWWIPYAPLIAQNKV